MSFTTKAFIAVFICLGLGFASGLVGSPMSDWYQDLVKPPFQPPPWVFGPAWTVLYTMMGIAIAYVWNSAVSPKRSKAVKLFLVQFLFNISWSPLFFGAQNPMASLIVILIMWVLIALTISAFYKIKPKYGYLLIPYLCWVTFATLLNASIVYLN